jgi:hypothetical protein
VSGGRCRRRPALPALLAVGAALGGCSATETGTSTGPYPIDPGSLTCQELQANGGQLAGPAAAELADSAVKGHRGSPAVAAALQTVLIQVCRGEPGSYRPGREALRVYRQEHG